MKYFAYRYSLKNKRNNYIGKALAKLEEYELQPAVKYNYKRKIITNESFRNALNKNLTNLFYKELEYVSKNIQNTFVLIAGKTGSGKSTLAKSITSIYQKNYKKINRNIRIYVVYETDELLTVVDKLKRGDLILRDENPIYHGSGSKIEEDAIINFMSVIRDQEISLIWVSPISISRLHLNELFKLKIESLGFNRQTGKNLAVLLNEENEYLGYIEIDRIINKELDEKMKKLKLQLQNKIKNQSGFLYTKINIDKLNKDIQKVLNYIKENNLNVKSVEGIYAILPFCEIFGTEKYLRIVCQNVKQRLRNTHFEDKKIEIVNKNDKEIKLVKVKEFIDANFLNIIIKFLRKRVKDDEKVRVFELICDGESYRMIKSKTRIPLINIKKIKDEIQQEHLGYAAEDAYAYSLKKLGINFKHSGYNSHEPDFVLNHKKQVHSLKCYIFENTSKAKSHIANSEMKYAIENNFDLYLVIYECIARKFTIYKVILPETPSPISGCGGGGRGAVE